MKNKIHIKICGIKDSDMATAAARAGADFIGVVFAARSPRRVAMANIPGIVKQARNFGAEPVAVFTEEDGQEMTEICQGMGIRYAQLHGEKPRLEQHSLPADIHRIYVCTVTENGLIHERDSHSMMHLEKNRDFLLFDGINPGSGQAFNWQRFSYTGSFPWFLAGGLTVNNVGAALQAFRPYAVDISSGVEIMKGQKEIALIENFIAAVRANI